MTDNVLVLGAVAYDPKVVTIWEGFKAYFAVRGLETDYVLFSNYERQVEAHLNGEIDLAWNSPLAWVRTRRLAEAVGLEVRPVVMRDADQALTSKVLVRSDDPATSIDDLRGRRVGVGAADSPQATLIPLLHMKESGLEPGSDFDVVEHDLFAGKHGDHGRAERLETAALVEGSIDAACILGINEGVFVAEGVVPEAAVRTLTETETFDHCNFTARQGIPGAAVDRFETLLLEMSYDDPEVRPLCELEGLKRWLGGRTDGYELLERAVDAFGFYDAEGAVVGEGYLAGTSSWRAKGERGCRP